MNKNISVTRRKKDNYRMKYKLYQLSNKCLVVNITDNTYIETTYKY